MDLERLIAERPRLFQLRPGEMVSFAVPDELLRWLDGHVDEGHHTLETGAGVSTVLFAMRQAHHTAIAPQETLMNNIGEYCERNGVARDRLNLIVGKSEAVLPGLALEARLDLVLIDGRHGFPAPFIDWYYTEPRLKVGGLLVVDDVQLWTGAVLRDYLLRDPAWEWTETLGGKTAIFRKVAEGSADREWREQPYVAARSRRTQALVHAQSLMKLMHPRNWGRIMRRVMDGEK